MEARVKRLEDDMRDIKADIRSLIVDSTEIKTMLKSVATKADVEQVKGQLTERIGLIEGQMKHVLSFWQFLIVVGSLIAIILRWPELFRAFGLNH